MIELRKPPKKPEDRKRLEYLKAELFPECKPIIEIDEDGEEIVIDCEEVPKPSLADVVKYFQDKGVPLDKVFPNYANHYNGYEFTFYSHVNFSYTVMEPEEEYEKRLVEYKKEDKEYKKWYKENREEVKAAKAVIKAQKEREKEERKLQSKKKRLERQQVKIKEELRKLGE